MKTKKDKEPMLDLRAKVPYVDIRFRLQVGQLDDDEPKDVRFDLELFGFKIPTIDLDISKEQFNGLADGLMSFARRSPRR